MYVIMSMMSSEKLPPNSDDGNIEPQSGEFDILTPFDILLGTARGRLRDAIREQSKLTDYRTFRVQRGSEPDAVAIANFTLANNRQLYNLHEAEVITLGVPIRELDVDEPAIADEERFFVLYLPGEDGESRAVSVTAENYNDLLSGETPLIGELDQKLLTFEVIVTSKTVF